MNSVDVVVDGVVFCTLEEAEPPQTQKKMTRRRRQAGGDDDRYEEFDQGKKLHAHSDSNLCHAAFYLESYKGKVSVPDHARSGTASKYLRGLNYEDLEGLYQAVGRLLDMVDDSREDPQSENE